MGFDFQGKTIIVTGGASGIGLALCEGLARRGARLAVADLEEGKAHIAATYLQLLGATAFGFGVDVSDMASVERLADEVYDAFGRVDGIFNNAGIGHARPLTKTSEADFDWTMGVNVKGVWAGCRVFGARFAERGKPSLIVNTASEHALGVPHLNNSLYTASKHAVLGLSDVLRGEMPDHVQVSVFCPGLVQSDFWNAVRNRPDHLGGPSTAHPVAKMVQDRGVAADVVAEAALAAIAEGHFYVVTHGHNLAMAEKRMNELRAAFVGQTLKDVDERYDVNEVLADVLGTGAKEAAG